MEFQRAAWQKAIAVFDEQLMVVFQIRCRYSGAPEARHLCSIEIKNEPSSVRREIGGEYAAPTELAMLGGVGATKISLLTELKRLFRKPMVVGSLEISFFVGDEVTSLKFLRFLKGKLETPYVVSYFFNRLSRWNRDHQPRREKLSP